MTKRSPDVLFIKAEEMLGLAAGYYTPEVHNFRVKLQIENKGGGVNVELNGRVLHLERDATLRLTRNGEIAKLQGSNFYLSKGERIRAEMAKSTFGQSMLEFHDDEVRIDHGHKAGVLGDNIRWNTVYGKVADKQGRLIIVYDDNQSVRGRAIYKQFVVRRRAMNDQAVIDWFVEMADRFPQPSSGAFVKALYDEWVPFAKQAAKEFYSGQMRKQAVMAMQPNSVLQPA